MTTEEREDLLAWAKAYAGCHEASRTTMSKLGRITAIAIAALEYAQSEHTMDANCSAGDCDSCSARDALEKLENLIGGPEGSRAFPGKKV